ncbi:MAG TPA: NAD(+) synthase [Terriglobales bacterium]|nr:NAD(+) synthase [Terriglobales bacterium]
MADNILRVVAAVPRVTVGCPAENAEEIIRMLGQAEGLRPDIVLFPQLCLTGATCGSLFGQADLLTNADKALHAVVKASEAYDFAVVVSLPARLGGVRTAACAVLQSGRLLAYVPSATASSPLSLCKGAPETPGGTPVAASVVFRFSDGAAFSVLPAPDLSRPPLTEIQLRAAGCDVVLCPAAYPAMAGTDYKSLLADRADKCKSALVFCSAGAGESTGRHVYRGFTAAAEPFGTAGVTRQNGLDPQLAAYDVDLDIVRSATCGEAAADVIIELSGAARSRHDLKRTVSRTPYLPETSMGQLELYSELFELQKLALCGRLTGTGLQKVIVGVSGGLDSTLALLVASGAIEMLGLPCENLVAVTMPGFGTTDRTYQNALTLIRELGATFREVPIAKSVTQHFEDIGHDPAVHNATYENAQARERTQILLDMANTEGALMLGTGDLSEISLGWCTFGGDHLAGYGVNSCLTKGMIRGIVGNIAALSFSEELREALKDILDTPVSPELLPGGAETQGTENILGPYELHDFFLFHTVKYGFSDEKLLLYAAAAFPELTGEDIARFLSTFRKKFVAGQFKRACATESPAITNFTLHDYVFPSDLPTCR